jgi:hypothetical protein
MCLSRSYACKAASLPLGLRTINMSFFLNILRSLISNIYSSEMDRNVDTWIDSGFDDSKLSLAILTLRSQRPRTG